MVLTYSVVTGTLRDAVIVVWRRSNSGAIIDVGIAILSLPMFRTWFARVVEVQICTIRAVPTWIGVTFVSCLVAIFPYPPLFALAPVVIHEVITKRPILAWIWNAVIFVNITILPYPARDASTLVIIN